MKSLKEQIEKMQSQLMQISSNEDRKENLRKTALKNSKQAKEEMLKAKKEMEEARKEIEKAKSEIKMRKT